MTLYSKSTRERVGLILVALLGFAFGILYLHSPPGDPRNRSVPELIRAVEGRESAGDVFRHRVWRSLPRWAQGYFLRLKPIPIESTRVQACVELQLQGSNAAPAVPCLLTALNGRSSEVQLEAVRALAAIHPPINLVKGPLLDLLGRIAQQGLAPFDANCLFVELPSLARKLSQPSEPVSEFLSGQLSEVTRRFLVEFLKNPTPKVPLLLQLVSDLNRIREGPSIYETQRFAKVRLRPKTQRLLAAQPEGTQLMRLNRRLLEDAYPGEIRQDFAVLLTRHSHLLSAVSKALVEIGPRDPDVVSTLLEELADIREISNEIEVGLLIARMKQDDGARVLAISTFSWRTLRECLGVL